MDAKERNRRFDHRKPSDADMRAREALRDAAKTFACAIEAYCHDGREKALAETKLEESLMWANASIERTDSDPRAF